MTTDPFGGIELEPADEDLRCLDPACSNFGDEDFGEGTCPPSHARSPDGPYRDGKLWVLDRKCDTCIFRPGNLMHLREGARDKIVAEAIEDQSQIPCHETLDGPRSTCRGFYDLHRDDVFFFRLAGGLGILAFDPPPKPDTD